MAQYRKERYRKGANKRGWGDVSQYIKKDSV